MDLRKFYPYILSIVAFAVIFTINSTYERSLGSMNLEKLINTITVADLEKTLAELGRAFALTSIVLISIVFLLGPLSRFFPKTIAKYVYLRREVGLIGFGMAAIHAIYSLAAFYDFSIEGLNQKQLAGLFAGSCALLIFFLLSITSNKKSMEVLGAKKWKDLQRFGYVGLFIATMHFYILETTTEFHFEFTPISIVLFVVPVMAILVKLYSLIVERRENEKKQKELKKEPTSD